MVFVLTNLRFYSLTFSSLDGTSSKFFASLFLDLKPAGLADCYAFMPMAFFFTVNLSFPYGLFTVLPRGAELSLINALSFCVSALTSNSSFKFSVFASLVLLDSLPAVKLLLLAFLVYEFMVSLGSSKRSLNELSDSSSLTGFNSWS